MNENKVSINAINHRMSVSAERAARRRAKILARYTDGASGDVWW